MNEEMEYTETNTLFGHCRCCLTHGKHRDLLTEYYDNGIREVYSDIFLECFNLYLSTDANISSLICLSCIQQLRNAVRFKKMVMKSEQKQLDKLGNKQTIYIQGHIDVKMEPVVKVEAEHDIEYLHYNSHTEHSDNDDVINDMLKSNETSVEGEAELLARFPLRSLKRLPTRQSLHMTCKEYAKHLDSLKGKTIKPETLERIISMQRKNSENLKEVYVTEKFALIHNATTMLEFSNLTPFKTKTRSGFPCFYCRLVFEDLEYLRKHQLEHNRTDIKKIFNRYSANEIVVYVDVTDLKCTLCDEEIPNLNELKTHLMRKHDKRIYLHYTDRVIPFKLVQNNYECQICMFNFETFGFLERHMNQHYRNYVCEKCGSGFVTQHRLKVHMNALHVGGKFPCKICKKVYNTHQRYKSHFDSVHKMLKKNRCMRCSERFNDYFKCQQHMAEVHGLTPLSYKCNVCDKTFKRRYALSCHTKRRHLDEKNFQCDVCAYKCHSKGELAMHMVKHNGERSFECSVCKKTYARKKTLKEHMRIHNNDRRFACAICGQAFVQNCSLKGHMRTHHKEYFAGFL